MTKTNPILTTIDYEKEGKQTGYLRLPHSVHRSAYGWLPFPVACIRNGEGPTTLLLSGTHGDEYEGQVTLSKLIHQLEPKDIQGRLIILPMLNFPAAKAGLRTSPIDELNLNRVYPGDPEGTPTLVIAHYVENFLMPMAELWTGSAQWRLFAPLHPKHRWGTGNRRRPFGRNPKTDESFWRTLLFFLSRRARWRFWESCGAAAKSGDVRNGNGGQRNGHSGMPENL